MQCNLVFRPRISEDNSLSFKYFDKFINFKQPKKSQNSKVNSCYSKNFPFDL